MKIRFRCGCGLVNYDLADWLSHFKYDVNGKWRAFELLMKTRIEIVR